MYLPFPWAAKAFVVASTKQAATTAFVNTVVSFGRPGRGACMSTEKPGQRGQTPLSRSDPVLRFVRSRQRFVHLRHSCCAGRVRAPPPVERRSLAIAFVSARIINLIDHDLVFVVG